MMYLCVCGGGGVIKGKSLLSWGICTVCGMILLILESVVLGRRLWGEVPIYGG